jgi:hypothetical protein
MPKLKTEFSNMLDNLQGFQWFSIVTFSNTAAYWKEDLQQVNPANIAAAKAFVNGLDGNGGTLYAPALQKAYDIHVPSGIKLEAIYFLSDGEPNRGDCWLAFNPDLCYRNIYAKDRSVYINTIQLQNNPGAQRFLESMARVTHGKYKKASI